MKFISGIEISHSARDAAISTLSHIGDVREILRGLPTLLNLSLLQRRDAGIRNLNGVRFKQSHIDEKTGAEAPVMVLPLRTAFCNYFIPAAVGDVERSEFIATGSSFPSFCERMLFCKSTKALLACEYVFAATSTSLKSLELG
jgi:hypothetical protein